ncbi:MAG TPA: porin family protein [Terriglobales bacterium]|nr:porin family protein [Terriglobales bacterium]
MKTPGRILVLFVLVLLSVPAAVHALAVDKGIEVGANYANFRGQFADLADTKPKLGFVGGPFVGLRVAPDLTVQVEALYTMKGAKVETMLTDEAGNPLGLATSFFNLSYLEVPLLLRASFLPASRVQPMLYLGPTLGFALSGRFHSDNAAIGDGKIDHLKPVDVGVAFGGGASTRVGGLTLIGDFRYTTGFTDIYDIETSAFGLPRAESINNVLSLMLGVGF